METTSFLYESGNVRVIPDLLLIGDSRYQLNDVNAVFISQVANYRRYPVFAGIFALLVGIPIISGGLASLGLFCLLLAAGNFIGACLMRTRYVLRLRTRFGETRPLTSTDRHELELIREAVIRALDEKLEMSNL